MDDYVDDAFDDSAAYAWVENAVTWGCKGNGKDCCPMAMIRGESSTDSLWRMIIERFSVGYDHTYGSNMRYLYYGSCDPQHPNNNPPPNGMGMEDHFGF